MTVAERRDGMLGQVWDLEFPGGQTVRNVEGVCRGVLLEFQRRQGRTFESRDFEELLAYLLSQSWVESLRFEPRPGIKAEPWLYQKLRQRLIDQLRSSWGRNGQKRVPDDRYARQTAADEGLDGWQTEQRDPMESDELEEATEERTTTIEAGMAELLEERLAAGVHRRHSGALTELEGLLAFIDWDRLSDRYRRDARTIAALVAAGYRNADIAAYYGRSDEWVGERMRALRNAMRNAIDAEAVEIVSGRTLAGSAAQKPFEDLTPSGVRSRLKREDQLESASPSEHCAEPGCMELLPRGSRSSRRYCEGHASGAAAVARHRDSKRPLLAA